MQCTGVHQLLCWRLHIRGRSRGESQQCGRRYIQPCDSSQISKSHKLQQVAIFDAVFGSGDLMLVVEIFLEFCDSDGRIPLVVERGVIASAQEAVCAGENVLKNNT